MLYFLFEKRSWLQSRGFLLDGPPKLEMLTAAYGNVIIWARHIWTLLIYWAAVCGHANIFAAASVCLWTGGKTCSEAPLFLYPRITFGLETM